MLDAQTISSDFVFPKGIAIVGLMQLKNELHFEIFKFVESRKNMDCTQFVKELSTMIKESLCDDKSGTSKTSARPATAGMRRSPRWRQKTSA